MQHGQKADLSPQMFGIRRDRPQGLGRGPEKKRVHYGLVLIGQGRDLVRDGKDDMVVLHRQQFGPPLVQPLGLG